MAKPRTLKRRQQRAALKVRKARMARIAFEAKANFDAYQANELFKSIYASSIEAEMSAREQAFDRDVRLGLILINRTPK